MKIELLQKVFIGDGINHNAGEVIEVDDRKAAKLIDRGFAKKPTVKKAPKKTNRAVETLETPEDE